MFPTFRASATSEPSLSEQVKLACYSEVSPVTMFPTFRASATKSVDVNMNTK